MRNKDFLFQIECLTIELAHLFMDEYGWDMNRALDEYIILQPIGN